MQEHFSFPSNFDAMQEMVQQVLVHVPQHRFSSRKLYHIRLSLDEAMTNAVKHGNQENPAKKVDVAIAVDEQSGVTLKVSDEGEGFDYQNVPQPTDDENLENIGGRGVFLVTAFADEFAYNERGNQLMLRFHYDQ
ncbi:ATP-binding protein [Chrysiogenes arsenatis]|uniref:ATP-binding protein n=1 Tax=Chrysiogenes arsenatis TaxID=309797 RepID=UPI0003F73C3E|nr:ATP-binding protein [Chrysiogenes arsenatis]